MKKSIFSLLFVFSLSVCIGYSNGFKLTTKPIVLPPGTDGSYGTKGTYVLFGDWPQTLKEDDITLSFTAEEVNGWECYEGSDGFYYAKVESSPCIYGYEFYNGKIIEDEELYYFKLEPIKWRVVSDNYQGGKLLMAENVLASSSFFSYRWIRTINNESVYPNNYKYSTIRAYLNGLNGTDYDVDDFEGIGFINKAFTTKAIKSINTVTVDNSVKSTIYDSNEYACENTEDKIFLLSLEEITKSSYGFEDRPYRYDEARAHKATDFAGAVGAVCFNYEDTYKHASYWWLRSPDCDYIDKADYINFDGDVIYGDTYDLKEGIVPALSISF